ncbi:RING finger and CHY zinc finger domain-containing protein [Aspergillus candidus]|uniref:Zf-CHY-domain-containing protein n=1 Tax=Aspergillus candidus TaxID=41067 RepID=A0A2I2F1S4_ASPCN|nr:zf-CHY-domain-containing protein [Aspergillus candidus]PLB34585.1 zf-CHY-domain-containing protein [Aspergillus candidus]
MASNIRQEETPIMGQRQGDAGSEDGAYRSATSPRSNLNNRPDHDTERSSAFTNTELAFNHASAQSSEGFSDATHPNVSTRLDHDIDIPASMRNAPQRPDPTMERAGTRLDGHYGEDNNSGHFLLPEDDGMGALRSRIHAIRDLHSSSAAKARMVHELMTENYNAVRDFNGDELSQMAQSPPRLRSAAYPGGTHSGGSHQPFDQPSPHPALKAPDAPQDIIYNLTAEDLMPTFFPKVETADPLDDADDADTEELEDASLGCQHYKRNVKLQCYTCKKWYTCRFCHDEIEDHHLDRPKTENMLCMLCGHPQPAAQDCTRCGVQAALYYCSTCKLWDNDCSKSIYHCNDCGICRIGQGLGKDFFHCKRCSVCLPISIENTHRCIERSTQCDCPICGDYMFTSPETVVFMRCGHSIHQKCLSEHSKSSYRCPICSKTITNMESTFRNLDRTIESQPMPAEFKDTSAIIYCNDCSAKSVVKYHWLGLKCDMCESYNTAQIRLLHGDALESSEQEVESANLSNLQASSPVDAGQAGSPTLTPSRLSTSPVPGPSPEQRSSGPLSAEPSGQFASYSLTRDRAVSPVISNYFGIPPERGSERPKSASIFGRRSSNDAEKDDTGELRFWGARFKYKYGFLSRDETADGTSEVDSDGGREETDVSETSDTEDDKAVDDDDDDDDESIDIFGHR